MPEQMPKDRPPPSAEQNLEARSQRDRGASEENFDRAMKKAIKETQPRDEAPPLPTKKVVKSPPRSDER